MRYLEIGGLVDLGKTIFGRDHFPLRFARGLCRFARDDSLARHCETASAVEAI